MRTMWPVVAVFMLLIPTVSALTIGLDGEPAVAPEDHPRQASRPIQIPAQVMESMAKSMAPLEAEELSKADHQARALKAYTAPTPTAFSAPGSKELELWCPPAHFAIIGGTPDPEETTVVAGCPYLVFDEQDPFANIQLAVYEDDPRQMVFSSLHGRGTDQGPNDASRQGQVFTAFLTDSMGASDAAWSDTPKGPMDQMVFGEETEVIMDPEGNIYLLFLGSKPMGDGTYDYAFEIYKGPRAEDAFFNGFNYNDPQFQFTRWGRDYGYAISEISMAFMEAPLIEQNATDNETAPTGPGTVGDLAGVRNGTDLVAVAYLETAVDWTESVTGMGSWIDVIWSDTSGRNTVDDWTGLPKDELIGPCRSASNVVAWDGYLWVACGVEAGYHATDRARIGDIHIWKVDPRQRTSEYVADTQLNLDDVKLAVDESFDGDGFFAVAGTRLINNRTVEFGSAMGYNGHSWSRQGARNVAQLIHDQEFGGDPIIDAQVTALEVSEFHQTMFIMYHEYLDIQSKTEDPDPPEPDPENPFGAMNVADYRKALFSMDACEAPIGGLSLNLGGTVEPYQVEAYNNNPSMFNDNRDGTQIVNINGRDYLFFVLNDYGAAQYGAVVVDSGISDNVGCPQLFVPPIPPTIPLPAALSIANPYTGIVGSTVGAGALAMVGYLVAAKKKNPFLSAAKAK